jgi:hypothetical protein
MELLGWRTRLIERTEGHQKATNIVGLDNHSNASGNRYIGLAPISSSRQGLLPTAEEVLQQHYIPVNDHSGVEFTPVQGNGEATEPSMDALVSP